MLKHSTLRNTAGTLWLVIDQSPSMQTPDPQALVGERLDWAESMGLIKEGRRFDRPDVLLAQVHRLAGEMAGMKPHLLAHSTDERAGVKDLITKLQEWDTEFEGLINLIEQAQGHLDSLVYHGVPLKNTDALLAVLRDISNKVQLTTSELGGKSTLAEAQEALHYDRLQADFAQAEAALAPMALAEDDEFATAHAGDAEITSETGRAAALSRHEIAQTILSDPELPATKQILDLAKKYNLRIASFADEAQADGNAGRVDAAAYPETLASAFAPAGQNTDLKKALEFVGQQISADEEASIVIVTDGRNNAAGSDPTEPAKILASRDVRIYGLLTGSHAVSPDAAVDHIDYPEWIFKGDKITIKPLIRLDGLQGKTANVELLRDGVPIQRQSMTAKNPSQSTPIEFIDTPPDADKAVEYKVRISEMPGEVNTQNNASTFRVAVKKDKLYALIIEDRPRWEYRYLYATLVRDQRLKVETIDLDPAVVAGVAPPDLVRASPNNPKTEAQLLPITLAEWQAFDIIVLGDVSSDVLNVQAQQNIAAAVRDKGATLITIAGERHMPADFTRSVLADILPVSTDPQFSPQVVQRHTSSGFRVDRAPTVGGSGLVVFDTDPLANARIWSNLPLMYWHSPLTAIKPAASALWTINDPGPSVGNDPNPVATANKHALLSTMTVGLGRSLFLASDQTWRLRQVEGADMHERFWKQVLAWAVGSDLPAGGKFVRFGASQPNYSQDQPAVSTARELREDLTTYTGVSFSVVARAVNPTGAGASTQTSDAPVEARFQPMESPGYYTASLGGLPAGDVELSLKGTEVERLLDPATDPTVTQKTLLIKVDPTQNTERKNMNTDPIGLDQLAHLAGGYSLDAQYADILLNRLPDIEHSELITTQLGFFTDPKSLGTHIAHWSFLGLFALLLTIEWILRKPRGAGVIRMTFRLSILLALFACVLPVYSADTAPRAGPLILAHYLPWFEGPANPPAPAGGTWGWHWTMGSVDPSVETNGRRPIASHFYPAIGPYDSGDPAVLEYHLLLMKLAGIDGVIVDWYGTADAFDYPMIHRHTQALFDQAEKLHLRVAICYEDQTLPKLAAAGKIAAGDLVPQARKDLDWLAAHWFTSGAYVKISGRPVLLSFGQDGLSDAQWTQVFATEKKPPSPAAPPALTTPLYFSEHHRRTVAAGAFDWPIPSEGVKATARFQTESPRLAECDSWLPFLALPRFLRRGESSSQSLGHIEDDQGRTFATTLDQAAQPTKCSADPGRHLERLGRGQSSMIEPSLENGTRELETLQKVRRATVDPTFAPTAERPRPFRFPAPPWSNPARRHGSFSPVGSRAAERNRPMAGHRRNRPSPHRPGPVKCRATTPEEPLTLLTPQTHRLLQFSPLSPRCVSDTMLRQRPLGSLAPAPRPQPPGI